MKQKSDFTLGEISIQNKKQSFITNLQSFKFLYLLTLIVLLSAKPVLSQAPSHDPSTMIRNTDGRYWIFTTGNGIWCMSSSNSNFTDWRAEPTPFGSSWPSWISNYVTGFNGFFWAPDVVKVGNTFFLYYSCAGEGAPAAIGVATATNLAGPWTDQGMVVASNNAIDPAILVDGSNMWMTWGNWQTGIDICQLNTTTGKRLNSTITHLVSGQVEGPGIYKNGSYYYLFYQRGLCCDGVNSTYYMVVARSTSVTGPYTGERTFLVNKSGNIIGPGHFGYGEGKLTYHYYDGNDGGNAKLMITNLGFTSDGWPFAAGTSSAQILANGTYKLKNRANGKYLDNMGRTTDNSEVAQYTSSSSNNQRWVITYSGGFYKIRSVSSGKYLDNIGHTADGSTVGQLTNSSNINQQWTLSAEGSYYKLINRSNGKNVDTGGQTANGTSMQFWNNNPNFNQQWTLEFISSSTARTAEEAEEISLTSEDPDFVASPIPTEGLLTLQLPDDFKNGGNLNIYNSNNKKVLSSAFKERKCSVDITALPSGFYVLMVENNIRKLVKKVIKK